MTEETSISCNQLSDYQVRRLCRLLIFIYYIYTSIISIKLINLQDGWILGDWLINYASDFTRRGLPGTIAIYISNSLSLDIKTIISSFIFVLYSIFFFFSWKSLNLQKNIQPYLFLLLSPIFFSAVIGMPQLAARKEILWFALISYHTFLIITDQKNLKLHYILGLCLFPFLILSHEMLFSLLPMYLLLHIKQFRDSITKSLLLSSLSVLFFVITLCYKTDPSITQHIYESINLELTKGSGKVPISLIHVHTAIDALPLNTYDGFNWVLFHVNESDYFFKYTTQLLICIFFFYPIRRRIFSLFLNKMELTLILVSACQFLVLMAVAVDWGRFIYIFSFTLFFVTLTKKEKVMPIRYRQLTIFGLILFWLAYRIPLCCGYSPLNPWGANLYNLIIG